MSGELWSRSNVRSRIQSVYTFSTITTDVQQDHWTRKPLPKGLNALQNSSERHHHLSTHLVPEHEARQVITFGYLFCPRLPPSYTYTCSCLKTSKVHLFFFPSRFFYCSGDCQVEIPVIIGSPGKWFPSPLLGACFLYYSLCASA